MSTPDLRAIFLDPQQRYALDDVSQLTGITPADLTAGIANGTYDASGDAMTRVQLVTLILTAWPLPAIHDALGDDVTLLPPLLQPETLSVRLPRYQVLALDVLATDAGLSVAALLSDYLLDAVSGNDPLLEEHIPGFRSARDYPREDA
jgi:hypothetical protein